jgi:chromate transporter
MNSSPLTSLVLLFATLSLFSIGGGVGAMIPEFHRQAVETHGWMTSQQFADLYAISRGAPGPGVMIVPLIGFQVGGGWGAVAALLAFVTPAFVVTYTAATIWDRYRSSRWVAVVRVGLVPISVGLLLASAFVIARTTDTSPVATAVTIAAAALGLSSRMPLLVPLGLGAALGLTGML